MAFSIPRFLVAVSVAVTLGACAYATAIPVEPGDRTPGFRIYEVRPILIVTGQTATISFIPNYNKAYAVQFGAFLAKNHFKMDVANGLMTSVDAEIDSTGAIALLQDILKQIAPVLTKGATGVSAQVGGGIENRFQVYEFVFAESGDLLGLRPLILDESTMLHVKTATQFSVPTSLPSTQPQPPATGLPLPPG